MSFAKTFLTQMTEHHWKYTTCFFSFFNTEKKRKATNLMTRRANGQKWKGNGKLKT